jgi:integrase
MVSIQTYTTKQGKKYRVQIRKHSKHLKATKSRSFDTRKEAEAWRNQVLHDLKTNPPEPLEQPQTSHTVKDLIEYYRQNNLSENLGTRKSQNTLLKFWEFRLGRYLLTDLTPELINKFRRVLSNEVRNYAPGTIRQYMIKLRAILNVAVKELGWLERSPMAHMALPKDSDPRDRYLSVEEVQRLLRACQQQTKHPQIYPVVFVTVFTGMRLSEVLNIKIEQLNLREQTIVLSKTKTDKPHMIYLTDEVFTIIQDHIHNILKLKPYNWRDISIIQSKLYYDGREYLFPSMTRDKPVYLRNAWNQVRKSANLNDGKTVFHTLRHTTASLLAKQGKTLLDIAHVLNHTDMRSTRRYTHLTEQHLRENFAAITKAITGS